jgi:hypothetical protein
MLHLVKMCVGIAAVAELRDWQGLRLARGESLVHRTRHRPKRAEDILAGGSLYWVIGGAIRVRQAILALDAGADNEGHGFCAIGLDALLVETVPMPHRAFQGWRYLDAAEAPPDLASSGAADMPPEMLQALKELGLL